MNIFSFIGDRDFNRSSEAIALDLIFLANQYRAPVEKVTFGLARHLDQRPEILDDPNTFVPVKIDQEFDDRFSNGDDGFMYRRLPLSILIQGIIEDIQPPFFPFYTSDILDQINEVFKTQFTMKDLVEVKYHRNDPEFILTAHPSSLVWVEGTVMQVNRGDPIPPIVTVPYLSGFTPYVVP